jgi:ankyrin repeat protein
MVEGLRLALEHAARAKRQPPRPPLDASLAFGNRGAHSALLKLLLDHGANPATKGKHGMPLFIAIGSDRPESVRFLLDRAAFAQGDLDRGAYAALVDRKPEMLELLRARGADPVRHVRTDPQALRDAVSWERSNEVVEFLLKSGVDANALMDASLGATQSYGFPDPGKLSLLLQNGADLGLQSARRQSAFALIVSNSNREFRAPKSIPGTESRTYRKIDLVRMLLDHGASVNLPRESGGGQYDLLAHARREEPEMIALLVERGASLTPSERGGPITRALELERDDLAFALLGRDRKITPADHRALLEASRRGWRDVAQALLAAGANPDVAHEDGWTALGMAERRQDASLARMLADAGAKHSVRPPRQRLGRSAGEFEAAAMTEIDEVVFFDPPRFAFRQGKVVAFAFHEPASQRLVQVSCERSVGLAIGTGSMDGTLQAGLCMSDFARLRELIAAAGPAADAVRDSIAPSGGFKAEFAQALSYKKIPGPDGSEIHYLPVIAVGHGIFLARTVVLVPRDGRQAIVVQTYVDRLCEHRGLSQMPLCTDPTVALSEIARRLYARFGPRS